ncbi:Acyl-CoA dehydrogenase family member 11 [Verticillium dahliae VDG2]|nr:Acyl-CoA dehydrogenase family member 11 [Verticillium dahliae VDG2]
MGSKKHVLKGTFQPQNNLKPEGGFMGRFRDVGHSVARFLPKFKDDSDDMGAENAPEVNSTQKPHRSGLVSQKATSSRPGDKRRQSPEIDELAEDEKHHAKRQRRSNDLKTPPRVDIAALESRRTVAIAKRDVEEVQRITDQLEGNRLSSRTYQQSSKQPPEAIDSDDELNASPTKELDASDWDKIWEDKPLIYPASGKNRAQIIKDDIFRLEEHQCLNDNLIVFYLRYLQDQLETENAGWSERILFMNPWFYERLGQQKGRGVDYDAVKSWTAKIDLLSKDYIIVPVNEAAHWYLAIICHPGKLLPATVTDDKKTTVTNVDEEDMPQPESPIQSTSDPAVDVQDDSETDVRIVSDIASGKSPKLFKEITSGKEQTRKLDGGGKRPAEPGDARIITLDSMGNTHSRTCTNLKDYLVQEIKHKRQIDVETPPRFGWTARGIPEQSDFSSCGIYLLAYVERFLKQPDQVISDIVYKKDLGWSDIDPVAMRGNIRELIIRLRQEQNVQRDKEKQAKQDAKALKLAQKKMDIPAVDSSPAHAAQTPVEKPAISPPQTPKMAGARQIRTLVPRQNPFGRLPNQTRH